MGKYNVKLPGAVEGERRIPKPAQVIRTFLEKDDQDETWRLQR